MKLKDIIYGTILISGFVAMLLYIKAFEKKIVYVNVGELYDGFEMKKELEQVYTKVQTGRKQQLDSLEVELKIITKTLNEKGATRELLELFETKKASYLQRQQQFEEDNVLMQDQYTSKIRKQLNQYVSDYGEEHNCDYILGAEGSGVLMYAIEKDNVTRKVLEYINKKYKGIK